MAILTDGKGNVLELVLGLRGLRMLVHTNDGGSIDVRFPPKASFQFMTEALEEFAEAAPTWITMASPGGFPDDASE